MKKGEGARREQGTFWLHTWTVKELNKNKNPIDFEKYGNFFNFSSSSSLLLLLVILYVVLYIGGCCGIGRTEQKGYAITNAPTLPSDYKKEKNCSGQEKKKKKNGEEDTIKLNATDDENESEIKQPQNPNFK